MWLFCRCPPRPHPPPPHPQRVVECKIAAALLGKSLGLDGWQGMTTLKAVQEAAGKSTAEMVEYVATSLQEEPYTTAALTEELGSLSELLQVLSCSSPCLYTTNMFRHSARAAHEVFMHAPTQ